MDLSSLDLPILLVFVVPGFFFLRLMGIRYENNFEYFIMSLFAGMMVLVFVEVVPLTIEVRNYYELGVFLSVVTGLSYLLTCLLKRKIKCGNCCQAKKFKGKTASVRNPER